MENFDYNRLCTKFESSALVANFINHNVDFKDEEKLRFYQKVSYLLNQIFSNFPKAFWYTIDFQICEMKKEHFLAQYYALNHVNISSLISYFKSNSLNLFKINHVIHREDKLEKTQKKISMLDGCLYEDSAYKRRIMPNDEIELQKDNFKAERGGFFNSRSLIDYRLGKTFKKINFENTYKYKHVKTLLGHMSIENDMMQPAPIFCISSVDELDMFVTGDHNGTIKCWSTITGGLIEVFILHSAPVNDMLYLKTDKHLLISCSEDRSLKVIDLELLEEIKSINMNEEIIRISYLKLDDLNTQEEDEIFENDIIVVASTSNGDNYFFSLNEGKILIK